MITRIVNNSKYVLTIVLFFFSGMARVNNVECALCGQRKCLPAIAKPTDWEVMVLALIQVESGGDSLAVGSTNDLGSLQLTPIYVEDVNRILNEERYTLDDRRSEKKSIEMFEIYQNHYNPQHDIKTAIKLHNPGASKDYADSVQANMERIRNK